MFSSGLQIDVDEWVALTFDTLVNSHTVYLDSGLLYDKYIYLAKSLNKLHVSTVSAIIL